MKLNEKYEDYLLKKASKEGGRDFKRFTNTIFNRIKEDPKISKRKIRKLTKQLPLNYQSYIDFIDTSLAVAPIVNYVSQPADVRKNKISQGLKRQIATLTKNAKFNLKNPKQTVDRAYGIISDMKNGQKDDVHKDFTRYLNTIAPERERIMQEARERLRKNTKFFKQSLTDDLYKDYQDYIDLGFGKPDAVAKTLADNKIKNDHRIKRYLETEAHEDYEKAKTENAERNGFKYKYWRTQRDGRVRRSHQLLDGKIVKHDEKFKVGNSKAMYPGDTSLPIEERINCRCSTEFAFVPRGSRKGYTIGKRRSSSGGIILRPEEIQRYSERPEDLNYNDIAKRRQRKYRELLPRDLGYMNNDFSTSEYDKNMQYEVDENLLDNFFLYNNPQTHEKTFESDGMEYILKVRYNENGAFYIELNRADDKSFGLRHNVRRGEIYRKDGEGYYIPTSLGVFKIADDPGEEPAKFMARKFYTYQPDKFKYEDDYEPVLAKKGFVGDISEEEKAQIEMLGYSDAPYTTINFRDNEERFIEEQIRYDRAQYMYSMEDEEEVKKAEFVKNAIEATLDQHRFAMRVNSEKSKYILQKIFGGEGFKNIQETGEGYGLSDVDYRTRVSEELFGTPPQDMFDGIEDTDYERYGYLADKDIKKEVVGRDGIDMRVNQYGKNIIVFNKDKLAERTTFTLGDSFTHAYKDWTGNFEMHALAQPVTSVNPQMMAFEGDFVERKTRMYQMVKQKVDETYQIRRQELLDRRNEDTARFVDEELEKLERQKESGHLGISELAKAQADKQVFWKNENGEDDTGWFPNYIELQYHGMLGVQDVEEVHLGTNYLLAPPQKDEKFTQNDVFDSMYRESRAFLTVRGSHNRNDVYDVRTLRTLRDAQKYGVKTFVTYMRNTGKRNQYDIPIYEQGEYEVDLDKFFDYYTKRIIKDRDAMNEMVELDVDENEEFDDTILIEPEIDLSSDDYD